MAAKKRPCPQQESQDSRSRILVLFFAVPMWVLCT